MKFHLIVVVALGIGLLPNSSIAVKINTGGKSEAELNSEMVIRCQYRMGEFGNEGVDTCVKAEREARVALADYPDEFEDIVRRCYREMSQAGWDMVQMCSDKDAAARDALESYPAEHEDIVDACTDEFGRGGYHRVKRCADKQIAERQGTGD